MIPAAVVDASVAVKWVVEEADSDAARLLSRSRLEAPDLLLVESANILWRKVRSGDLAQPDAASRLDLLLRAPLVLFGTQDLLDAALRIAVELKQPVTDCVYLALAYRREIPLVTADRRLQLSMKKRTSFAIQVLVLADLAERAVGQATG